jgi:phage terminase small subunit
MTKKEIKNPKPDHAGFTEYWEETLPAILSRENFKPPHLQHLRVLCDLYVDYDQLQAIIDLEGRTYWSAGRNGDQLKLRPEVQQMNRVLSDIRNYSKMLGLLLVKDTQTNDDEEEDEYK